MPLYQQGGLPSSKTSLNALPQAVKSYLMERMREKSFGESQRQFNLNQALAESQMEQRGEMHEDEMAYKAAMLQNYYKPVNKQAKVIIDEQGNRVYALFNPQTGEWQPTGIKAPENPLDAIMRQAVGGMNLEGALTGDAVGEKSNIVGRPHSGDDSAQGAIDTWSEHQRNWGASPEQIERDKRLSGGGVKGPVRVNRFTGKTAKTINGQVMAGVTTDDGKELYPGDRFVQGQTVYEIDSVDAASGEIKATPVDTTTPARKR